ncbi:unnamed protein product [Lactuca saligna]|uniref:Uncharacterized protein n=1 Tax=Lactuca saligna TaxID=75948 RepID=A0AA35V153_LACSI|nr:unnamed protein product [Lactuca saligna]
MDQDFQIPIINEVVLPSKRAQASGSTFEASELVISNGKSKMTGTKFVDVVLLHNRVFALEQSSAEKDLIIGKQDIQISELEKESSVKDFQPLSTEGEKIYAFSSGDVNPTSQPTSERVVRHAIDANLDSFISFGPTSTQERREKQIRVEQLKGKMFVMKHSDQNAPGDHPEMFFRESGRKFTNKYGDCSIIKMWGYVADKKMWIVKRSSGQI